MKILYYNREEIFPQKRRLNQQTKAVIKPFLSNAWQRLTAMFAPQSEPRVWQTKRRGKTIWHGYDPTTGKKVTRLSEKEMLIWLEERYYQ